MRMSSSLALRLRGPLRQTELQHAMETLYVRHETLRTRFVERAGDLRQFVDAPGPLPLTVWDFRAAARSRGGMPCVFAATSTYAIRSPAVSAMAGSPVPARGCGSCMGTADPSHHRRCLVAGSAAAGKPSSTRRTVRDGIIRCHPSFTNTEIMPPGSSVARQPRKLRPRVAIGRKAGCATASVAAADGLPRSSGGQSVGASLQVHWDEARVGALQDLAARHDATLFIALQALVKLLLYRYSGQTDLIIGTPIAGRDSPALEGRVGLSSTCWRCATRSIPKAASIRLLEQASHTAYDAYTHRDYPFDSLIEDLTKPFDTAPTQLFNVLVALQNVAAADVACVRLAGRRIPLARRSRNTI